MPPKSKDSRVRLGEPLATDFAALRAALGLGNTEIGVIREAVREYINRKTKNKTVKQRYDAERARIHVAKVKPLRVVSADDASE